MPSNKKIILDIIMVLLIASSFGVSIKSCKIAEKAQEVSEKALGIAEDHFFQENRPYISVSPIKYEETDSYFKYSPKNSEVIITIKYEVKNTGKTVAKDVQLPEHALLGGEIKNKGQIIKRSTPDKVSIGPGEKLYLNWQIITKSEAGDSAKEFINNFESGKASVEIGLKFYYLDELNTSIIYETFIKHKIYKTEAVIVKSEFTRHEIKP